MAQASFKFTSLSGESFTVVSFSGSEGISRLYRYQIEIKAPQSRGIDILDILDDPVTFVMSEDGIDYPVHGILASLDEIKTVQGYVYYSAVLVPQLWKLTLYKTNEIYTHEKTVDNIVQTVLEGAGLYSGDDFELGHLNDMNFLRRDYVCQFGESDFDFISRLLENEGIFYYFDQSGPREKLIFVNDAHYPSIDQPDMIYESHGGIGQQHRHIYSMARRVQRLPASVSVRDYNPEQPSHDIANTLPVDNLGTGTEYLYGSHITNDDEATSIAGIRAEEMKCRKTRFIGEGHACRFHAGFTFALDKHPNDHYNAQQYLLVEVNHQGAQLDSAQIGGSKEHQATYHNSFIAIESSIQFRPPLVTPKPRFYGTMTAFIYAEAATMNAEIDEFGRYRVHLPFDRADGTLLSSDPNRKASTWIRMAQPYVGEEQGMYFPLAGGTEVLLTFINGDPDQPIISGALPNASQPSLLTSSTNFQRTITAQPSQVITGNTHRISRNSAYLSTHNEIPLAPGSQGTGGQHNSLSAAALQPSSVEKTFINQEKNTSSANFKSMIPPWSLPSGEAAEWTSASPAYDSDLIKFKYYAGDFSTITLQTNADGFVDDPNTPDFNETNYVSTDRGGGDTYVYANGRTFAYPQHERVYFIGTFHEDFHVKDDFLDSSKSWTGQREQWNFPEPGGMYPSGTNATTSSDDEVNPKGIRGVSEDKRWGDQMFYAWGRSFNWSGGEQQGSGGAFGTFNYGNGLTENLIVHDGGTAASLGYDSSSDIKDKIQFTDSGWAPEPSGGMSGFIGVAAKYAGIAHGWIKEGIDYLQKGTGERNTIESDAINGIADARKLYPGTTTVDKTYGGTYSYHLGFAVDIHQGHSISKTYGDSESMVEGDSENVVHGDSYDTVMGSTSAVFVGAKTEMTMGVDTEFKLAMDNTFHVGVETGAQLAGFLKFTAGAGVDITVGPIYEGDSGPEIKTNPSAEIHVLNTHLINTMAKLEKATADIKSCEAKIFKESVRVSSLQFDCKQAGLEVHT